MRERRVVIKFPQNYFLNMVMEIRTPREASRANSFSLERGLVSNLRAKGPCGPVCLRRRSSVPPILNLPHHPGLCFKSSILGICVCSIQDRTGTRGPSPRDLMGSQEG